MKLTLDELITLMEPQAQRDKKLIVQCIDGLTEYAAELRQKAGDAGKAESSALRELIDRLEGYWGLDNSGENRLSAFDRRMREAEQSEQPWAPVQDQINGAVLGLYRYAMDMIPGQGASEAAEQVAECERLISGFTAAISSIPAGRTRVTRLSFERKLAACSRVRAGICIPTETVHLIPSRKASRIYTCTR